MYPRTAILMRRLFPAAAIRIIDSNREHLEMAKAFIEGDIEFVHGDVQQMTVATRAMEHTMEFCVTCHREKKAPDDCVTCHY